MPEIVLLLLPTSNCWFGTFHQSFAFYPAVGASISKPPVQVGPTFCAVIV
jgi:hypothetical protein